MTQSNKLKRVALVTGASSGIGAAAARQLLAAGFAVYGTSRRGGAGAAGSFPLLALDVTDDLSVRDAVAALLGRAGRIDLRVNNAGIGVTGAAEESSIEQVKAVFETNFHEVRGFGIRVAVIEPGATKTSFDTSTTAADQPLRAYDTLRQGYLAAYERAMAVADTPESVAHTIVRAALAERPLLRYPSGPSVQQGALARRFLPRALFDKVLHKQFGLA